MPLWGGGRAAGMWSLGLRLAAALRSLAAVPLATGRAVTRQTTVLWIPLLLLLPRLWPLAAGLALLGVVGEWLARKPSLWPWDFLIGFTGDVLAYSLGRVEGAALHAWRWMRGRLPPARPGA